MSLTPKDIKTFSVLGLTCVVIRMTFYQLAVMNTKASVVAVLFSCNPIFVMIFAYMVLKEKTEFEKLTSYFESFYTDYNNKVEDKLQPYL